MPRETCTSPWDSFPFEIFFLLEICAHLRKIAAPSLSANNSAKWSLLEILSFNLSCTLPEDLSCNLRVTFHLLHSLNPKAKIKSCLFKIKGWETPPQKRLYLILIKSHLLYETSELYLIQSLYKIKTREYFIKSPIYIRATLNFIKQHYKVK